MIFLDCSKYVYEWIKAQNHVKEESLTDWVLYYISQHCDFIYYKTFSRHEEAQNGSDWEWWVLTSHGSNNNSFNAFRFLVQAKKLLSNGIDNYSLINYGNRYGTQIDSLLVSATYKQALPLYMFYSTSEANILEQKRNVRYLSNSIINRQEYVINGCYLSLAFDIYHLLYGGAREHILDYHLLNYSFKFSLLDLVFEYHTKEIDNFFDLLNNRLINETQMFIDSKINYGTNGIKHTIKTIPNYVKDFIKNKGNIKILETETKMMDFSGLGVIDLRYKK